MRRITLADIEEAQLERLRVDRTGNQEAADGDGGQPARDASALQGARIFRTFARIASSCVFTRRFSKSRPRSQAMSVRGAHTSRTVTAVDCADGSSRKKVFQPLRPPRSTQPNFVGGAKSTTSNSVMRGPNRTLKRTPLRSGLSPWGPPPPGNPSPIRFRSVSRANTRSIGTRTGLTTVRLAGG